MSIVDGNDRLSSPPIQTRFTNVKNRRNVPIFPDANKREIELWRISGNRDQFVSRGLRGVFQIDLLTGKTMDLGGRNPGWRQPQI